MLLLIFLSVIAPKTITVFGKSKAVYSVNRSSIQCKAAKTLYIKLKELRPLVGRAPTASPGSANGTGKESRNWKEDDEPLTRTNLSATASLSLELLHSSATKHH